MGGADEVCACPRLARPQRWQSSAMEDRRHDKLAPALSESRCAVPCAGQPTVSGPAQDCGPRVAAVQWARRSFGSLAQLRASLLTPALEAAGEGAALVVFPDGVAAALAEVLPGRQAQPGADLAPAMGGLAGEIARTAGITLALGPVLTPTPTGPSRVAWLYGPDGRPLGSQAQTHRTAAERAVGLVRGTELAPVATPLGPVGLLSGADVEYPEVSRILALQGALVLVHHGALRAFDEALALARLWREVQANQVFGVEAYAVGPGWRGRSAVHAPVEITPGQTGWLARAPNDAEPALVVGELDLGAHRKLLHHYPILGLGNVAQYRRYLPAAYEAGAAPEEVADGDA